METTRLFSWILILVSTRCHLSRGNARNSGDDVIPLSMMEDSAAYVYNQSEESDMLAIEYLAKERKINKTLDYAWKEAVKKRKNDSRLSKVPVPRGLKEEHVLALIAYTLNSSFYGQFNAAVSLYGANDAVYAVRFPFKSFQYLLSIALERLREEFGKPPQPTYRRMTIRSIGKMGDRIKFGYFASSSRSKERKEFGNKTIFTISSQYGAQIQNYSAKPNEEEVLIPPYEAFKITRYEPRTGGVDISLQTDGEARIPVRVKRGSKGKMIVLRCEGTAIFPMAWFSILSLLVHISL